GRLKDAALAFLRETPGEEGTRAIALQLSTAADDVRQQLLLVLGDREDSAALPEVVEAIRSETESVRIAALQTLGAIGDGSSVAVLARIATSDEGAERAAARDALARLRSAEVDEALVRILGIAQPPFKAEVIRALGSRQVSGAVPALLQVATEETGAVRAAALQVLRELADEEVVPALVSVLLDSAQGEERSAAENAIVDVSRRAEGGMRAAAIQAVYPDVDEPSLNLALLRVMGRIGADESLDIFYTALVSGNDDVKDLAVRALADWPSPAPIDTVEATAAEASSATHRVLALRGFIRMVGLTGEGGSGDRVSMYSRALDLAERSEEKLLVIARLAELRSAEALRLVRAQLADDALRDAAQVAAERIDEYLSRPAQVSASHNSGDVLNAIDGNRESRWATGQPQEGGEWFLLDFGAPTEVRRIVLDAAGSANDYPRGYEVFISNTLEASGDPVVVGEGSGSVTEISLPPTPGRYLRIVQTGQAPGLFWSIHNIEIDTEVAE
ncbi:MAG: HEAT repeat domain-containing protein, partial [Opitutales bacterium]